MLARLLDGIFWRQDVIFKRNNIVMRTLNEVTVFSVSGHPTMLTDMALKQLKPKDKPYKVADRDGMPTSLGRGRSPFDTITV